MHFTVRWNIQIRLVEKVFFLLQVDQTNVPISFQVVSIKIYITNLVLESIHLVNLLCTQFAQLNKIAKWQEILRLCLGDIEKRSLS